MPLLLLALLLLAGCAPPPATGGPPHAASGTDTLLTTAERSGFRATTRHADVLAFLDALSARTDAPERVHVTAFGESYEGRPLPLAVVGAGGAGAEAVRASGKLRVLVVANIHAGEVAGKEAALMLLRDVAAGRHRAWTDSLALLVAPVYNADGNERIDPGNRPLQHGPVDGMGTRANAQGLDLNRDHEKLDSPEARALVALFNAYDPHVVLDLHTTNGTVHAYHLTHAGPLHPNTDRRLEAYVRERWLPAADDAVRQRTGYELFPYGNDKPEWGSPSGWATFDPRPRFLTNYVGLRNRFAILSEAYSYATFEERILATRAFVDAILDHAARHATPLARMTALADARAVPGERLATRSAGCWLRSPEPGTVLLGGHTVEENPHTGAPMWRRTEERRPTEMPMWLGFYPCASETAPAAYLVPVGLTEVVERLRQHGIRTEPLAERPAPAEAFRVDSVRVAERPFQGRHEHELFGAYAPAEVGEGAYLVVRLAQPLGRLAFSLLEPHSDSGFAAWGLVPVAAGDVYPILRVPHADGPRTP